MMQTLTSGNTFRNLLRFSIPYLISCFLQTFYGLADLFITGQFNGASAISAVSVGSQVMHMLTLVIAGIAMGTTVMLARHTGAGNKKAAGRTIGNSTVLFLIIVAILTPLLLLSIGGILQILAVPGEAIAEAGQYLLVCFIGIPFITAYNVISSIFRGLGDTKSPMIFVLIAGLVNIGLDYLLIGPLGLGARGAALATVIAQAISVLISLFALWKFQLGIHLTPEDFRPSTAVFRGILGVGIPIALQDGLIQISFLIITAIANGLGVNVSAAVGIVEKLISFLFLVPSAMQASITALAAQNIGAGLHDRAKETFRDAALICCAYAVLVILAVEVFAAPIVRLFTTDSFVVTLGVQYFRTYVVDTLLASLHFCFSGFFCAYNKAIYSFIHNMISVIAVRIPGALAATILFPTTLYALGIAAPLGSLLSVLICLWFYLGGRKKKLWN